MNIQVALAHAYEIKYRNDMMRLAPEENRLAGFPDPVKVKRQEAEKKAVADFIAKNLSDEWQSTSAFAKGFGCGSAVVLKQLKIMEKAGSVLCKTGRFEDRRALFWRVK